MHRFLLSCLLILALSGGSAQAQLRTFLIDPQAAEQVRSSIGSGAKEYSAAGKYLQKEADKLADARPVSVVEKKAAPPSGDKHDYMSMGKYWWPDPATKDGLPYIRRDGEVNPETKDFSDEAVLNKMIKNVVTLSYASYYLGDERSAAQAAAQLRVWFLDSATRMNPHLDFSQSVPGRNEGRGSGIIDAHQLPLLIDALGMLEASPAYTPQDREGMKAWFKAYLHWLRESKNGKHEADAKNNHGSWYDVQVVAAAMFVGDLDLARKVLTESREKRIASQIEPDGSMPKELERTRSFGYSMFNLKALSELFLLGERAGVDLWHYETKDGRSFRKALDNLLPYIGGEKEWTGKQIAEVKLGDMYTLLLDAARVYKDQKYAEAAAKLPEAQKLAKMSILTQGVR
jgi:hypothetical protein